MRRTVLLLPPLALLAWTALPVPEATAQLLRNAPSRAEPDRQNRPPPPALPGLQGRRAPEPIPADPNQNLSPNAALFDAINRGDLAAAREAVGRGADLDAKNVLGLTPLDAAVDQGQREIVFYLLSVRGAPRGAAAEEAQENPAPPPQRTARRAEPPAPRRAAAEPAAPAAPQPVRNPRLWAGDGGAPIPEIGFLGFDAGRPPGAAPPAAEAPARPARTARSGRG